MVEIVLITHGLFGEELYLSAEMIMGKQDKIHNISVMPGKSLTEIVDELDTIIKNSSENGVLILTDMFGGSPSNVAFSYVGQPQVEVVSGVNLPMLLKCISGRMNNEPVQQISLACGEAGKNSIKVASEIMLNK